MSTSSIPFADNESLIASAPSKSLFDFKIALSSISFSIFSTSKSVFAICLFHSEGFLLRAVPSQLDDVLPPAEADARMSQPPWPTGSGRQFLRPRGVSSLR